MTVGVSARVTMKVKGVQGFRGSGGGPDQDSGESILSEAGMKARVRARVARARALSVCGTPSSLPRRFQK